MFGKQGQEHRTQEREQRRPVTRPAAEVISTKWQNNHNCNNAKDYFNSLYPLKTSNCANPERDHLFSLQQLKCCYQAQIDLDLAAVT